MTNEDTKFAESKEDNSTSKIIKNTLSIKKDLKQYLI